MPAALWCQSLCRLWLRGRYVLKLNTRVMKDLWFPKIPSETESRDFFKIFGHAILVLHDLFAQTSATLLALPRHSLADSRRLRSTGSAPCPITPAVTAENLFLRKQLALFRERQVPIEQQTPRAGSWPLSGFCPGVQAHARIPTNRGPGKTRMGHSCLSSGRSIGCQSRRQLIASRQ